MRNIFLFVRNYFNFLLFLSLQVFCIYLIVHYNSYHNAIASSYMTEITGNVNAQYNKIDYYFNLKKTNDSLQKANERLYNQLKKDFILPDTASKIMVDTIHIDSLQQYRRYEYVGAKVISNSVAMESNYLELGRGSAQQIKKGMGVVDPNNAVVGIITDVSNNYAVVMSLLNKEDSHISGMLKNSKQAGTVIWDGKDPNILTLTDIRKTAKVTKGDSVITTNLSPTFPYGLMIGTVVDVQLEKNTDNYIIRLKSAANFYNLAYVFAIDNLQPDEANKLLDKAKKQNQ